jgi:hypothetical protein
MLAPQSVGKTSDKSSMLAPQSVGKTSDKSSMLAPQSVGKTLNKLVVQTYTGQCLFIERTAIYALLTDPEKEIFRRKVLIDISVDGLSCNFCGCDFDLSVWKPLYTDYQMTDFVDTMEKRTYPK